MAFKVFLSYGAGPGEQVTAWRLQTLATTHGIHVFVPQHNGTPAVGRHKSLSEQVKHAIDQSDCVLAIITGPTGPAMEAELSYALSKRKLLIPIVQEGAVPTGFLKQFPRVFPFSPWKDTGKVESDVVGFLKQQKIGKENLQALGALVTVGLGLFLLSALSEK